jgi:DNA/RNA endonuclease G (NUC1)
MSKLLFILLTLFLSCSTPQKEKQELTLTSLESAKTNEFSNENNVQRISNSCPPLGDYEIKISNSKYKGKKFKSIAYESTYNQEYNVPIINEYELKKSNLCQKTHDRYCSDCFVSCSPLTNELVKSNFKKNGYHIGHLAPDRSFSYDKELQKKTYCFENIAKMLVNLNTGRWLTMEYCERYWAVKNKHIKVFNISHIHDVVKNENKKVQIPSGFQKVILTMDENCHLNYSSFYAKNSRDEKGLAELQKAPENLNVSFYLKGEKQNAKKSNDFIKTLGMCDRSFKFEDACI